MIDGSLILGCGVETVAGEIYCWDCYAAHLWDVRDYRKMAVKE